MFFLLLVMVCFSCKDRFEEEFYPDGVLMTREPLWKTSVNVDNFLASGIRIPPTIYDGGVLMGKATGFENVKGTGFDRPALIMLDTETGKINWEWNNYMYDRESLFLTDSYQNANVMVFHNGGRTYSIDLRTGQSLWRKWKIDSVTTSAHRIAGIGNKYFYTGASFISDSVDYQPSRLFAGDILTGQDEVEVINPQLPREYFGITPIPRGATFFKPTVLDGDTVIVVAYQVPTVDAVYNIIKTAFGLYNLEKKQWIYKDLILLEPQPGGVVDWCPVIHNGKVYWNANRDIICNDLRTSKEIWRKAFRADFLFTPLIIAENKVIANNEDTWLYAMDVNTGTELWRVKSAGTSSHLVYLDGYVYYAGGGDGLLHAVDVSNGKKMWKLISPDMKVSSRAHFQTSVSGIPAKDGKKGRVFVNTGLHVYCYEAIK